MAELYTEIDSLRSEIQSVRPLDPFQLKQIHDYYRIGLTYTSNALEGNSLTESETKVVIEDGLTIGGKPLKDHFEALGHGEAYNFIYTLIKDKNIGEDQIRQIHRLFYYRIDANQAGAYRQVKAFISGSRYPLPLPPQIPQRMVSFIKNIPEWRNSMHPVVFCARAHKEFVFIHPFVDGNGRVARLLMNLILLQEGYPVTLIPPVLRHEYIASLEKAHRDESDFQDLIARCVHETLKEYVRLFEKNGNPEVGG